MRRSSRNQTPDDWSPPLHKFWTPSKSVDMDRESGSTSRSDGLKLLLGTRIDVRPMYDLYNTEEDSSEDDLEMDPDYDFEELQDVSEVESDANTIVKDDLEELRDELRTEPDGSQHVSEEASEEPQDGMDIESEDESGDGPRIHTRGMTAQQ